MKFCKHCGKQMEDDARFCMACGTPVAEPGVPKTESISSATEVRLDEKTVEVQPKKKKTVIAVLAVVLAIVVACGAIAVYQWYNSDEQKVIRALDSGELKQALEIVQGDKSLRESEKMANELSKCLDSLMAKFYEEKAIYSDVLLEINTIRQMDIPDIADKINETADYVTRLNQSRMCFSSAETFFEKGSYVEAMGLYAKVIEEDQNYEQARSKYSESVNNYRKAVLSSAAEYAADGNYTDALKVLNFALQNLLDDSAITEQILVYTKAEKDAIKSAALLEAEKYAEDGDYESALTVLEKYMSVHGEDADVSIAYEHYDTEYTEAVKATLLDKATEYAEVEDYAAAIKILKNLMLWCEDEDVQAACNGYRSAYVNAVQNEAEDQVEAGEYLAALNILKTGWAQVEYDEQVKSALTPYAEVCVSGIVKEAEVYIEEESYREALKIVEAALNRLPDNEMLLAEKARINDLMPQYLLDVCPAYETSSYAEYTNGNTFSMSGNAYTNGFILDGGFYNGYAYFNLSDEYDILKFYCGHIDGSGMLDVTMTVYLDGVAAETINLGANGLPRWVEVNVSGVHQLKIQINVYNTNSVKYGFAEVTVQKNAE